MARIAVMGLAVLVFAGALVSLFDNASGEAPPAEAIELRKDDGAGEEVVVDDEGDDDRTRGDDGTDGGENTGDGDSTGGNDGTRGGDNTVEAAAPALEPAPAPAPAPVYSDDGYGAGDVSADGGGSDG